MLYFDSGELYMNQKSAADYFPKNSKTVWSDESMKRQKTNLQQESSNHKNVLFKQKKTYRRCLLNVRICCSSLFNVFKNCIFEVWSDKRSNMKTPPGPRWTSFIIFWRFNRQYNWQIHDEDSHVDADHKSTCCQRYWIILLRRNCQKKWQNTFRCLYFWQLDEKSSIFNRLTLY